VTINYQQPFGGFYPGGAIPPGAQIPYEQSYIENILRLNKGKQVTIYMNFEGSQWGSKVFKGELLAAGRDHIIIRDSQTGLTYLLLRIYLSYITFDEPIEYEYPFN
jgi:spore germination protein Q